MIIWRGWGALPIAIAAACIGLGVAMSSANPGLRSIFVGLMLVAGGAGTWVLGPGVYKNRCRGGGGGWVAKSGATNIKYKCVKYLIWHSHDWNDWAANLQMAANIKR